MPTSGVGQPTNFMRGPVTPLRFEDSADDMATSYIISGITRDANDAVLPGVTVELFDTATDQKVLSAISDANGAYRFDVTGGHTFYAIAYLTGSPDVAGTTVNTLTGV